MSKVKVNDNTTDEELYLDLAAATLTGDIRDYLLARIRTINIPWAKMTQSEQEDQIAMATSAAESLVSSAVRVIAAEGRKTMVGILEQVVVKDGLKAVIKLSKHDEMRHDLIDAQGTGVMIVVADPSAFTGEQSEAKSDPDQMEMDA